MFLLARGALDEENGAAGRTNRKKPPEGVDLSELRRQQRQVFRVDVPGRHGPRELTAGDRMCHECECGHACQRAQNQRNRCLAINHTSLFSVIHFVFQQRVIPGQMPRGMLFFVLDHH